MSGFSFGTPTTTAPSFSFGNTTTTSGQGGFNFGAATPNSSAPTVQFNTSTAPPAMQTSGFTMGPPGGAAPSLGTPTAQSSLFRPPSSVGSTFGSPATTQQPSLAFPAAPAGTGFGAMSAASAPTFGSTLASTTPGLSFSSTPATSQGNTMFGTIPATSQPLNLGSNPQSSLTFGSAPALSQPNLNFGSAPATTQLAPSFGSTPTSTQPNLSFGSTTASVQPTLSFGSTPSATQPAPSFGSTTASTQPSLNFGSTTASTQPTLSFGSTPTSTQPNQNFGSNPASTQPSLSFGSTPATSQPTLSFGITPATTQTGLFGSTATTTQSVQNVGLTPAMTSSGAFSLGAPATTATSLSFGLGGAGLAATTKPTLSFGTATSSAPTAPTTVSSLLNFSTPKTTATTGFSLSVSGGGTGSLFAPSTSTAPTSSAPAVIKGLGGVATSTTQGSGQKDNKSVKENPVNPEIMQTLDTFKNFVKQQKTLSCEVSRAPVKPMHKVTEDTDALKQLLTSVASALQKNKVIANKLKADTTKCLSLCEMAQRTHDTPPGLQNDNVAPLEFFIQLVSKFEQDIQLLRQEIDNTEKHVNSLAYPSVLTPQELSVALRRLHDSFVALAGRLQTAHAGVTGQKERHLGLRRHFLKDHTNIFDATSSSSTRSSARKPNSATLSMPGPTPFSSLGGMHNMSFIAGQDKPVTFSSGPTALSGWGSSTMPGLNMPASNFLQTPGTSILSSPQPVDNQNFQLGKPPPGNKRGKR